MSESRHLYILTDGVEIFGSKAMTPGEAHWYRREAANSTGGNVNWERASNIPVADAYKAAWEPKKVYRRGK